MTDDTKRPDYNDQQRLRILPSGDRPAADPASEPLQLPEPYAREPDRYLLFKNGAIFDRQANRIVANIGGPHSTRITAETSQAFHQRRKELGVIARMRALAAAEGIELPEDADLEDLARHAAKGIEALTLHMARTFKSSKNLRGMAETYGKLSADFLEDRTRQDPEQLPHREPLMALLAEYVAGLVDRQDTSAAIEGEILEDKKGE